MRNALEVLQEMQDWWHSASPLPRTSANAINVGITWLFNRTHADYARMTQESSKLAYFRQLFTVWKAVCSRLSATQEVQVHGSTRPLKELIYPFYDPRGDAMLAFPRYVESFYPELFPVLLASRAFLGVSFPPEDTARHEQLRKTYVENPKLKLQPHQQKVIAAALNRRF